MIYLESFKFATQENEYSFRFGIDRTCYDSWYPFGILTKNGYTRKRYDQGTEESDPEDRKSQIKI